MPRWPRGGVFSFDIIEDRPGIIVARASGKGAADAFKDEAGGHRWQENSGKTMHTSTITVAVLQEPTDVQIVIREQDLDIMTCRSSGSGGQHINKTDSAVQIRHIPSGIMVRCEGERSQLLNKEMARSVLRARLWQRKQDEAIGIRADDRRRQIGSGQRADKRRTIRSQDDVVNDHLTGKQWKLKNYLKGDLD